MDGVGAELMELYCRYPSYTHFFWSFLFFSAGPPIVPIPKPSFGEPSASGVPAGKRNPVRL